MAEATPRVLSVIPPMTQLNTPYPSAPSTRVRNSIAGWALHAWQSERQ